MGQFANPGTSSDSQTSPPPRTPVHRKSSISVVRLEKDGATVEITGKTTFRDLLDAGLTQADIEKVLGGNMPNPGVTMHADAAARGANFGKIRDGLSALLKQR